MIIAQLYHDTHERFFKIAVENHDNALEEYRVKITEEVDGKHWVQALDARGNALGVSGGQDNALYALGTGLQIIGRYMDIARAHYALPAGARYG